LEIEELKLSLLTKTFYILDFKLAQQDVKIVSNKSKNV